jgi:hypothetical protein
MSPAERCLQSPLFRCLVDPRVFAAVLIGWLVLEACVPPAPLHGAQADDLARSTSSTVQREGTTISEVSGQLRSSGPRWTLVGEGDTAYRLLENLTLQRIVQAFREDPEDRYWTVSGELTEFLGENYLLLRRGIRTPQPLQQRTKLAPSATVASPDAER